MRGGTKLQLPLYGLAGRLAVKDPTVDVQAEYWFITSLRKFERVGYAVTDEVLDHTREVLGEIVDGIEHGVFPPHPEATSTYAFITCHTCNPDGLGTAELRKQWDRKRHDPAMARVCRPRRTPRRGGVGMTGAPPDQAARERIASDLDTTLFVEAGAGSGKTTALVGRVVALVTSGAVELRNLAAITFTEKAGAELRDRVRRELQERQMAPATPAEEAERCGVALGQLDGAAIGTLHSFAQRLLSEHPVEAHLPPKVEVLDEVSSAVAFDRRWTRVLDELLDDPDLERTILLLHAAGVDPSKLRSLALAFEGSWDLVEDLVPARRAPSRRRRSTSSPRCTTSWPSLAPLAAECIDGGDRLAIALAEFAAFGERLLEAADDELDLMDALLGGTPKYAKNAGQKGSWRCNKEQVHDQLAVVTRHRRRGAPAGARRLRPPHRHRPPAPHPRGGRAPPRGRHARVPRPARAGPARAARSGAGAGRAGIAPPALPAPAPRRVPGHRPDPDRAGRAHRRGRSRRRRRRAVGRCRRRTRAAVRGGRPQAVDLPVPPRRHLHLPRRRGALRGRSRRASGAPGQLPHRGPGHRLGEPHLRHAPRRGARHRRAVPVATAPTSTCSPSAGDPPTGPPVAVVGTEPHPIGAGADVVRTAESRDVAHVITTALAEGWSVHERQADGDETWRPCRLGDITLLIPARTTLPFLEDALTEAPASPTGPRAAPSSTPAGRCATC